METINMPPTDYTPKVLFDPKLDTFEISSRSLPENASQFYAPILNWLKEYLNSPKSISNFVFHFEIISTASTKEIIKIILLIDKISKASKVKVNWNYDKNDFDLRETGQRLEKL